MAEQNKEIKPGEVVNPTTATESNKQITTEEILKNQELMAEILKSDAVKMAIQSEADRVRTKASREKESTLAEFNKYKSEMDSKIAELTKFQANYLKTETLRKSGLDLDLWDYVSGNTEAEILKNAEALKTKISSLAQKAVGVIPDTSKSFTGITAEQFGKMTYSEKAELYQTDRELYNKLAKK